MARLQSLLVISLFGVSSTFNCSDNSSTTCAYFDAARSKHLFEPYADYDDLGVSDMLHPRAALVHASFVDIFVTVAHPAIGIHVLLYVCLVAVPLVIAAVLFRALLNKPAVYCVENAVFVPPTSWQVTHEDVVDIMRASRAYTEESLAFVTKTLERSAIGQSTHFPPARTTESCNMAASRQEAEDVIFPIVREVFAKTGFSPRDIDFLIVNCSLFSPTPSLCAMICHEFQLRPDVRSLNLGGMGCSANVIAVDLAKQLLQNERGSRALVVSTEIITPNLYMGNEKSMLLQNALFRCGGVALLLSSRRRDAAHAKYELLHTERVQIADDEAFEAVTEREDAAGNRGVALSKQIVTVAGRAMKQNLTQIAVHVLPASELAKTVLRMILIRLAARARKAGLTISVPQAYTPDFSKGVDHFCIHAGGRAVIDGVQKNLLLSDQHMKPSRQTLFDFGNTSSSSIWYEAEWIERFGNLRKGQRILQVTFGSGFKCNTAIWRTLRVDQNKSGVPIKPVGVALA